MRTTFIWGVAWAWNALTLLFNPCTMYILRSLWPWPPDPSVLHQFAQSICWSIDLPKTFLHGGHSWTHLFTTFVGNREKELQWRWSRRPGFPQKILYTAEHCVYVFFCCRLFDIFSFFVILCSGIRSTWLLSPKTGITTFWKKVKPDVLGKEHN